MRGTEYASAVAAVRAMENTLLSHGDIEQLLGASSSSELNALLASKKADNNSPEAVWSMISEYAPDNDALKILLYKNDFHNLKAALKAMISDRDARDYFIFPTNLDTAALIEALAKKDYESLPAYISGTAQEAYELLTRTLDGQLSDSFIDNASLREMQLAAEKSGSDFMMKYASLTTACADIKTAWRCCKMGKSKQYMDSAVCGSSGLDKEELIKAALEGTDSILALLESTEYAEAAQALRESPAQFEKWCDDAVMALADETRSKSFGIEPLAAYYIAKEAEIKNIRIIKICRECGSDRATAAERMRKLYV